MKYSHSWAVKMEMQCWEAICAIVYCPLHTLQSTRFVPVKVSQMFVFGFTLKKKKGVGVGSKENRDTSNRTFICFFSFLVGLSRYAGTQNYGAGCVSQQVWGCMGRPVDWTVLKNKAFNQKCVSSCIIILKRCKCLVYVALPLPLLCWDIMLALMHSTKIFNFT